MRPPPLVRHDSPTTKESLMKRRTISQDAAFVPRLLAVVAALAFLSACSDTPTPTQPLEVAGPSASVVGQGQGAFVDHFSADGLILMTIDMDAGLYAVHYTNSVQVDNVIATELLPGLPCNPVPTFHGALDVLDVLIPSGKGHTRGVGETYVIVHDLSGFPFNLCDEPVAEGAIRLALSIVNQVEMGSPTVGRAGVSASSNGVITNNADGGTVRLHHTQKGLQNFGTVSLR